MKKITFLFLIISQFVCQAQWIEQITNTQKHLCGIDFIDSLTGVAVGYEGTILRTVDGGINWNSISSPSSEILWKVRFYSDSIGWVSGGNGCLLKTIDGGVTWDSINSNTNENIENTFFIDESVGWLIGLNGTLKYSNNGGESWMDKSFNQVDYFTDLKFIQDTVGILSGKGVLYRTNNSGLNWNKIDLTDKFIMEVFFINEQIGWLCGEDGIIYKSIDSGLSWEAQESGINEWLQGVYFINVDLGWAVGRHGTMVYTMDGGINWESYPNPIANNNHMISVDFINEDNGWACAGSGRIIKYSKDPTLNTISFNSQNLNIYPNPANETSIIHFSQPFSDVHLALYDINGRNLGSSFFKKEYDGQYMFTRDHLDSGVYYIVISNQEHVWSEKIVLK
ncbi:MAG: YCF48-related protein [Flavobacteriales bacterium]